MKEEKAPRVLRKKFRDIEVSALGFGGFRWPMDKANPKLVDRPRGDALVDRCFECGINYFDTAYTYQQGDSERFFGESLTRYPRDSYYLATKFYVVANPNIEEVFETQLRRCNTKYFDFYLIHCMDENNMGRYMDPRNGYLEYLLKQKAEGRIRYLGFSSHAEPESLRKILAWYDGFDMAQIQLNYVDWSFLRAKEQYEILTEHNIPVWVMEPLKGGRLSTLSPDAAAILQAARPEWSLSSWGMRFLQTLPNVQTVLSGMNTDGQILDNTATFSAPHPLTEEELATLFRAKDAFMEHLGVPCSACRYCCDTCPAELDIPLLIRAYNELSMGGETWRFATMQGAKGPEECLGCGTCLSHCPQRIQIPDVLKKLAEMQKK